MNSRRAFLRSVLTASVGTLAITESGAMAGGAERHAASTRDRDCWVSVLKRIAEPVLSNLTRHELKKKMPVEAADPYDRAKYTHLEAFGRTLAGIAPWLAVPELAGTERDLQQNFVRLAQGSLDAATDPHSPDFMNFRDGGQPLVDTAFLAQGILRAPQVLWHPLPQKTRTQIIEALKSSRAIPTPTKNNWVMFAAMVEAALHRMGEETIDERFEACVRRMLSWYKGDGVYGDGEFFHFDYYNSFVIHPMLLDAMVVLTEKDRSFQATYDTEIVRARRFAEIQERLIAPDGSFPSIGRSTTYRFGALQTLAQIALIRELPDLVRPAQVRSAMTAVIRRMIEAQGTFDEQGWLRVGFCGHQPSLAENYISTGSVYLCTAALLPLGLHSDDEFWSEPATRWTSQRIWAGESMPADHALPD